MRNKIIVDTITCLGQDIVNLFITIVGGDFKDDTILRIPYKDFINLYEILDDKAKEELHDNYLMIKELLKRE